MQYLSIKFRSTVNAVCKISVSMAMLLTYSAVYSPRISAATFLPWYQECDCRRAHKKCWRSSRLYSCNHGDFPWSKQDTNRTSARQRTVSLSLWKQTRWATRKYTCETNGRRNRRHGETWLLWNWAPFVTIYLLPSCFAWYLTLSPHTCSCRKHRREQQFTFTTYTQA